jgi:hypothetical protein
MQASSPHRQGEILFAFDSLIQEPAPGWHIETEIDLGTAKVDLYLRMVEDAESINAIFEYSRERVDPDLIRRLGADLASVLEIVTQSPALTLNEIHQRLVG